MSDVSFIRATPPHRATAQRRPAIAQVIGRYPAEPFVTSGGGGGGAII